MRQILCPDWLPERARWSDTAGRPGTARFVPTNKISPKLKRVHESFLSPKLFFAKVKRFFWVFSVFMEPEKASTRNENKVNKNVDEFSKYLLQQKPGKD